MTENSEPVRIGLLGATGSIGASTLEVVRQNPGRLKVDVVAAHSRVDRLEKIIHEFRPSLACMSDTEAGIELAKRVGSICRVESGSQALVEAAASPNVEVVVGAVVGFAGLESTLSAIDAGKHIALANKESLVAGGDLVSARLRESGSMLLSVDSEHSSIHQCLVGYDSQTPIQRVTLTASGGPFLRKTLAELSSVTPAQAVKHPSWNMGAKISVDSATMMNKGLEIIEAHRLFHISEQRIEVLIHPQSIVHGFVEFADKTVIAALSEPSMQSPIAFVLGEFWFRLRGAGRRVRDFKTTTSVLNLATAGSLEFMPVDVERFSAVRLCREALRAGGTAPLVLNAANEVAVAAFLAEKNAFLDIVPCVEEVLARHCVREQKSYEELYQVDAWARREAELVLLS